MIHKVINMQDYKASKNIKLIWRRLADLSHYIFNKTVHLGFTYCPDIFEMEVNTGLNFCLDVVYFLVSEKRNTPCSKLCKIHSTAPKLV